MDPNEDLDKVRSRRHGSLDVIFDDRHNHPNQCGIGAIVAQGIEHHIALGAVFAGDDPIAGLVPVEHQTLGVALLHDIAIDFDRLGAAGDGDLGEALLILHPAAAWQAVLRRVRSLAVALGGEGRDEQPGMPFEPGRHKTAHERIVRLQDLLDFLFHDAFLHRGPRPEHLAESSERRAGRNGFGA